MTRQFVQAVTFATVPVLGGAAVGRAGAVNGPRQDCLQVSARANHTLSVWFKGGDEARVALVGDGEADLDVYVY